MKTARVLEGHVNAFQALTGAPRVVLCDNLKTAVDFAVIAVYSISRLPWAILRVQSPNLVFGKNFHPLGDLFQIIWGKIHGHRI